MPEGGEPGRFPDRRWVAETGSTNADVLALARQGAPEGVVVVAGYQRRGRGRRGRSWTAPPGSALLASVLLRPALAPRAAALVSIAAGLASAEACSDVAGVTPGLKWPNDLVVGAEGDTVKLAGLLADSLVDGERLAAVVVGMGLNVSRPPATSTPVPAPPGAAYLEELAGRAVAGEDLLDAWLGHLDRHYPSLGSPEGRSALLGAYRRRCVTLGRPVRVALEAETLQGRAVDVTGDGHLVVDTPSGRRVVSAGDAVHLRPGPPDH